MHFKRDMSLTRMPSEPNFEASEDEFLECLRMDIRIPSHRIQYRKMKAQVLRAHERICSDRTNLLPYLQHDPSIRPPFTLHQITENALYSEAQRIYSESQNELRQIYDEGSGDGDNWVIRWLLWRVFQNGGEEDESEEEDDNDHASNGSIGMISGADAANSPRQGHYWDPVREAISDVG